MSVADPSTELLGTVELRIPSRPEWVAVARLAIAAIANRLPFSVEEIEDIKLAVAEGCTICIQQGDESGSIDLTCEASIAQLRIELRDGRYRTRAVAGGAPNDESMAPVEGLGIFLIQALMDSLDYGIRPDVGTELVMTKRVGA